MGCCFSTSRSQEQNPDGQIGLKNQQTQLRSPVLKSKATHEETHLRDPPPSPPPIAEEESVKEVLTETPISKPQVPTLTEDRKTQMATVQHQVEKFETEGPIIITEETPEVSQISEACSVSESFSTATTATVTEKKEDDATSKRSIREETQKWNRSASEALRKRPYTVDGNITSGRERRLKSPAIRSEPSPEKKILGSSRSVRGRESGQVATRKLNAGSPGVRRDPGEGSGRRSRSPSSNRASKGGQGGGRNQLKPLGATGRQPQQAEGEEKEDGGVEEIGEINDTVPKEESLENPHVSMECFIFL